MTAPAQIAAIDLLEVPGDCAAIQHGALVVPSGLSRSDDRAGRPATGSPPCRARGLVTVAAARGSRPPRRPAGESGRPDVTSQPCAAAERPVPASRHPSDRCRLNPGSRLKRPEHGPSRTGGAGGRDGGQPTAGGARGQHTGGSPPCTAGAMRAASQMLRDVAAAIEARQGLRASAIGGSDAAADLRGRPAPDNMLAPFRAAPAWRPRAPASPSWPSPDRRDQPCPAEGDLPDSSQHRLWSEI